jgi:hypothetical protein
MWIGGDWLAPFIASRSSASAVHRFAFIGCAVHRFAVHRLAQFIGCAVHRFAFIG